jgi:hypothetical protein
MRGKAGAPPLKRRDRMHVTPALTASLVNIGMGFVAVALATVFRRPTTAAVLVAAATPVLCVVTLFFALSDLLTRRRGDEGRIAAWLALLLLLVPMLLLYFFLHTFKVDHTPPEWPPQWSTDLSFDRSAAPRSVARRAFKATAGDRYATTRIRAAGSPRNSHEEDDVMNLCLESRASRL